MVPLVLISSCVSPLAYATQQLAEQHKDSQFVKVNVDSDGGISAEQGVQAMPTFKLFKSGAMVGEVVGANAAKLKELVAQHA